MITAMFILLGILVITGVSLLAVGRFGQLPDVQPDMVPDDLPTDRPLRGADLQHVRFDVTARGYRMDEVDGLLDRLATDMAEKDATIAALRDRVGEKGVDIDHDVQCIPPTSPAGHSGSPIRSVKNRCYPAASPLSSR